MVVRVVLAGLVVALLGGGYWMSVNGIWGESRQVVSTRVGSGGGGYGPGGGGVK